MCAGGRRIPNGLHRLTALSGHFEHDFHHEDTWEFEINCLRCQICVKQFLELQYHSMNFRRYLPALVRCRLSNTTP